MIPIYVQVLKANVYLEKFSLFKRIKMMHFIKCNYQISE